MFLHLLGVNIFWLYLLEFVVAATFVFFAGSRLAVYGDIIADNSKFSHGWIGFILMASITSLPELMTGISSTALVGAPDLLIGDTIGSNAVNVVILALMFIVAGKSVIKIKIEELVTAFAGLILLGLTAIFISAESWVQTAWQSLLFSLTLLGAYFYLVFLTFKTGGLKEEEVEHGDLPTKGLYLKFTFFALLIVFASIWMTQTSDFLSKTPFWVGKLKVVLGQTFVGALLLSIATSLPELSVTLGAARLGNVSMAVGNIFGSNVFNIFIIPIAAFFFHGVFWNSVSGSNMVLVLITLLVTAIMGVDLVVRSKLQIKRPTFLNFLTLVVWVVGMVVVFFSGHAA